MLARSVVSDVYYIVWESVSTKAEAFTQSGTENVRKKDKVSPQQKKFTQIQLQQNTRGETAVDSHCLCERLYPLPDK